MHYGIAICIGYHMVPTEFIFIEIYIYNHKNRQYNMRICKKAICLRDLIDLWQCSLTLSIRSKIMFTYGFVMS